MYFTLQRDLTHWPLEDLNVILKMQSSFLLYWLVSSNLLMIMPQGLTDDKSTMVQVMAWCRQATSHYLNQCWPTSPTSYGVTRSQWVNWKWGTYIWFAWYHWRIWIYESFKFTRNSDMAKLKDHNKAMCIFYGVYWTSFTETIHGAPFSSMVEL